jgi:hypothetical protein
MSIEAGKNEVLNVFSFIQHVGISGFVLCERRRGALIFASRSAAQ